MPICRVGCYHGQQSRAFFGNQVVVACELAGFVPHIAVGFATIVVWGPIGASLW
jgi:hypothetical protein